MKIRSVFSLVSFLFVAFAVAAQSNASFSTPLDIPQVGWNKVLCMKNGHTMLFHFEVNKPMIIKVFDSTHKEIASQKYSGKLLDQSKFMTSLFQGCFEVNGEAVLFLYQEHVSKPCLFRMRVNDTTGMVTEEKIVGESISVSKPTQYLVTKGKDQNGYTITSFTYTRGVKERDLHLSIFNMYHQIIRVIPLPIIAETDDDVDLLSCDHTQGGINAAICTRKMEENSTVHRNAEINTIDDYDHIVTLYFVPYGDTIPRVHSIDLSKVIHPYYALFTYNSFADAVNVLLLSYWEYQSKNGLENLPKSMLGSVFLSMAGQQMDIKHKWILNDTANLYYRQQTDTTHKFEGLPIRLFTASNGLSTIVSQSFDRYIIFETRERPVFENYFGNICVTQTDDNGNELWGRVLPLAQYYKSYQHYYVAYELGQRAFMNIFFADLPEQVYNRQFVSANSYTHERNYFVVYNDYDSNFGKDIKSKTDTVYDFGKTNACYYKVDRKKEVTKHYVFGTPAADEHKATFIEGADHDERSGTYVSLVQCKKGDEVTLCMAWAHLE